MAIPALYAMLMSAHVSEPIGAALVLLTLPLVIELVVLTFASLLPRRYPAKTSVASPVQLAVIIPAHNEELLIASCIRSLLESAAGAPMRIITVAHNCSDRTAQRATEAGAEVIRYDEPAARGKGSALAFGFAYAAAQGIDASLVVDADSIVSGNLVAVVREALDQGAEAVQCRYEMDSSSKRPATRLTALAFRGFNVIRPSGRDRLGLSAGILGNGFAIRQEPLQQNPYQALSVVEDLEFHVRLVLAGKKVRFLDQARVSSALPHTRQGEATQRSRWEGGRANAALTWLGPLFKQLMRGQLSAFEPMLDLTSLPIGYGAFLLLIAAGLPLAWLRIYGLTGLAVIACHVLTAAASGSDFAGDLRILARAPGYILWKLCMLPRVLRNSRTGAPWVRTERQPAIQQVNLERAVETNIATSLEIS